MPLRKLLNLFRKDLAMDLGTANSLLYTPSKGIVLNEPSVVAFDQKTLSVIAVGVEAKRFIGRTPKNISTVRPLKDGVIADFDVTRSMISHFIRKAITGVSLIKPSIVICVPTGITQIEKRAVVESAEQAGVRGVRLVEEPMAAAIGAGMPIHEPSGNMVMDIGGGTSEVAVISMSAIAYSHSLRVAGDEMNEAVQRYMQEEFQLQIGENMAEAIKIQIGSADELDQPLSMEVSGKNMVTGAPDSATLTDGHIREALADTVKTIVQAVGAALEKTPPELVADIAHKGLLLAGGGGLLRGMDRFITREIGLKTVVDRDPLTTVVRGTGKTLEDRGFYERVYIN